MYTCKQREGETERKSSVEASKHKKEKGTSQARENANGWVGGHDFFNMCTFITIFYIKTFIGSRSIK